MSSFPMVLFTTVYPEGEKYLPDFFTSIDRQDDKEFDLVIGLDRLKTNDVEEYIPKGISIRYIERNPTESNILMRQRAIKMMVKKYTYILFVDSDDILLPTRVSAARHFLELCDVYGCAMRIIDEQGKDLNILFHPPCKSSISTVLPRFNIFGMSNTAYSSKILEKCLPFPEECVLLDWFVATKAWMNDASFIFDSTERMKYRQHSQNTARVLPPFTPEQIIKATHLVLQHYDLILKYMSPPSNKKYIQIKNAQQYICAFDKAINNSPEKFQEYIRKLNKLPPNHIWWSCVAHPELEEIWKN